jgi:hypothetical protein
MYLKHNISSLYDWVVLTLTYHCLRTLRLTRSPIQVSSVSGNAWHLRVGATEHSHFLFELRPNQSRGPWPSACWAQPPSRTSPPSDYVRVDLYLGAAPTAPAPAAAAVTAADERVWSTRERVRRRRGRCVSVPVTRRTQTDWAAPLSPNATYSVRPACPERIRPTRSAAAAAARRKPDVWRVWPAGRGQQQSPRRWRRLRCALTSSRPWTSLIGTVGAFGATNNAAAGPSAFGAPKPAGTFGAFGGTGGGTTAFGATPNAFGATGATGGFGAAVSGSGTTTGAFGQPASTGTNAFGGGGGIFGQAKPAGTFGATSA